MSRTVKRWIATCAVVIHEDRRAPIPCDFNDRRGPMLHETTAGALRESMKHLLEHHDLHGAREIQVIRTYKPRELESEEIVSV